jgi:hypothetical protein
MYNARVQEAYVVSPILSAFVWLHSRKNDEKLNMLMSEKWCQMTTSEDTYIVHKVMIETTSGLHR